MLALSGSPTAFPPPIWAQFTLSAPAGLSLLDVAAHRIEPFIQDAFYADHNGYGKYISRLESQIHDKTKTDARHPERRSADDR